MLLAPMEDVTDPSFRLICREQGAGLVYTEFVSAEALVRDIKSTTRKLAVNDRERPVAIQIYGRDADAMVQAAQIVDDARDVEHVADGADADDEDAQAVFLRVRFLHGIRSFEVDFMVK